MRRRIVGRILCLAALASLTGCGARTTPVPVEVVSVHALTAEWRAHGKQTFDKYKGKIVEVSGIVSLATNDTNVLLPLVRLADEDAKNRFAVQCYFSGTDWAAIQRLCEGQKLSVRGQLIESDGGEPMLLNCQLRDVGESPALGATIAGLIEEYKTNDKKMAEKYDSHWLIVEGFVAEIERPKVKKIEVKENKQIVESEVADEHCFRFYFKSDDNAVRVCAVCCGYQNDDILKKCALVRLGQKIKVLGRCDKIEWRDKKRIELTQGRLLDN